MIKTNKFWSFLIVSLFCLSLTGGSVAFAASPARQLAKGISLYDQNKDDQAMDYFIDVMVSGDKEQVAEANKYVELIHNRIGGIQTPVEVDINFKEGEVKNLEAVTDASITAAQKEAEAKAAEAAAKAEAAKAQAQAKTATVQNDALAELDAQQQALSERIEAERAAAKAQAEAARQAAIQKTADVNEAVLEASTVAATAGAAGLNATEAGDLEAIDAQTEAELNAADGMPRQTGMLTTASEPAASTFADLTSPEAVEARDLYTRQKLESMTAATVEKIKEAKGVHLYFRDNLPDALDMDADVIFKGNTFRPEALPLLNSIYELLALTQGAGYIILPPGSYTDDVTLSGIRQAMALNSYFTNRGISQGKLYYNLGLVDQEPPARFANLNGLSVVFDFASKLPTRLEKNEGNSKAPLLSMAVVPLCHAIDRSLGEAFAIDFSVLETINPVDNWVFQVVQHGRDGNFYVVRQLEGFTPVYHQILWNGRKGIIGPDLPCGKYTLVLTATDLKGEKQTLRRRVVVKCSEQKTASCTTASCQKTEATDLCPKCNYQTPRLWVKPGRTMSTTALAATPAPETYDVDETVTNTVTDTPDTLTDTFTTDTTYTPVTTQPQTAQQQAVPYAPAQQQQAPAAVNNPYDMPYEDYGN